tara:strand:+ start:11 stop:682 length:672 start_codon:yes stop_codon:yes gene_type:complete
MAVSVDTVYQTVLALANKEQRGYITPQEFNLFANHAQMDIFEQYFYDLNQFKRVPGNQSDYADMVSNLQDKISIFIRSTGSISSSTSQTLPEDFYRASLVTVDGNKAEHTSRENQEYYTSPLISPTKSRPIFYLHDNSITFKPTGGTAVVSYIKKPTSPNWTYVVVNDKALWNSNGVDFELHPSEQQNLVVKIAKLAGISMKDATLAQAASSEEISNIQQEKA